MMRRVGVLVALLALAGAGAVQPEPPLAQEKWPGLSSQLAGLHPDRPSDYLRLGEMILVDARSVEETTLARHLLVVAADRAIAQGRPSIGASACLALSRTSQSPSQAAWLEALARGLEPALARPDWLDRGDRPPDDPVHLRAASALALLRSGDPRRAKLDLDAPGVREALEATPEIDMLAGHGSLDDLVSRLSEGSPCPECRGQGFIEQRQTDRRNRVLCTTCLGQPGPSLSLERLILLLRAELRLVGAADASWSAHAASGRAGPVRAPEASMLAQVTGLNPALTRWRDGRWVADAP